MWEARGYLFLGPLKYAWQKFRKPGRGQAEPADGVSQADFDAIRTLADTHARAGISGTSPGVKITAAQRDAMVEALRKRGLIVTVNLSDRGAYESMSILNPYSPYALLEAVEARLSAAPDADALLARFDREDKEYVAEAERLLAPSTGNPRYTRRWR